MGAAASKVTAAVKEAAPAPQPVKDAARDAKNAVPNASKQEVLVFLISVFWG